MSPAHAVVTCEMNRVRADISNTDGFSVETPQEREEIALARALLDGKKAVLSFPESFESEYELSNRKDFSQSNKNLVLVGICIYFMFFLVDLIFYKVNFTQTFLIRVVFCGGFLFTWFQVYKTDDHKYVIPLTLLCNCLMFVHMMICGLSFFSLPYNVFYSMGVLPSMIFGVLVFRACFRESIILVLSAVLSYSVIGVMAYPYAGLSKDLQDMFLIGVPIVAVLMLAVGVMGVYMAYEMDKINRKTWLRGRIMQIESEKLQRMTTQFKRFSITDGLTSLYNRRFFDVELMDSWLKCKKRNTPMSLIMLDVDWFKDYNDLYGHQSGDTCLQNISLCLKENCHINHAVITRYGGEEFIIILPNEGEATSLELAEKICLAVYNMGVKHEGSPVGVCTVSVGVHTLYPNESDANADDKVLMRSLLKNADKAMYRAKSTGKNKVSVLP